MARPFQSFNFFFFFQKMHIATEELGDQFQEPQLL